ncbi:MAG: ExbD/TolR family protein [Akkermansiaceae bacterium]
MKRHQRPQAEESLQQDEPGLDISSLIDVCFLLLIYFLVTTTIQPREQDLNTTVPVPGPPNATALQPMVIEVQRDGAIIVNPGDATEVYESSNDSRDLPRLRERVKMITGTGVAIKSPQVMIKVHNEAKQQRYIDVLNCLAGAGIEAIALVE